jgi:ferritin
MASNTYMDSVIFEQMKDTDTRAKSMFDYLRQTGNELILATIQIVGGIEARREASLELRDISWRNHHHSITGEPI